MVLNSHLNFPVFEKGSEGMEALVVSSVENEASMIVKEGCAVEGKRKIA